MALNGMPLLTWRIEPTSHPRNREVDRARTLGSIAPPTSHVRWIRALWRTSKSESPRLSRGKRYCGFVKELPNASVPTEVEAVSRLLLQVYEPWTCNPCDICLTTLVSSALYSELPIH